MFPQLPYNTSSSTRARACVRVMNGAAANVSLVLRLLMNPDGRGSSFTDLRIRGTSNKTLPNDGFQTKMLFSNKSFLPKPRTSHSRVSKEPEDQ